jgi:hypothetical protein
VTSLVSMAVGAKFICHSLRTLSKAWKCLGCC